MNTINTTHTPQGTLTDEEHTRHLSDENSQWDTTASDDFTREDIRQDTYNDQSLDPQFSDSRDTLDADPVGSPFGQTPQSEPTLLPPPPPLAGKHSRTVDTHGDPVDTSSSDEVLHIVHNEGEDKPWEIKYGEGINAFQKVRAILNYPVHKFETEAKAQEVAEMLRGIIDADAVEQNGRVITKEGEDDKQEFFHPVSERGESPPGVQDTR